VIRTQAIFSYSTLEQAVIKKPACAMILQMASISAYPQYHWMSFFKINL